MANAQYYPMARAIIGGLISSTFLTLIVLPTYYRLVNGWVETVRSVVAGGSRPRAAAVTRPAESAAK